LIQQQEKERMFPSMQTTETCDDDTMDELKSFLATESKKLSLLDVNKILEILTQRKVLLEAESVTTQNKLLHEFLQHLLVQTENLKRDIDKKIILISKDVKSVENILKNIQTSCPQLEAVNDSSSSYKSNNNNAISVVEKNSNSHENDQIMAEAQPSTSSTANISNSLSMNFRNQKHRMLQHFDDFVKCYYANRADELYFQSDEEEKMVEPAESEKEILVNETLTTPEVDSIPQISKSLEIFRENLSKFSKYNQLRTLSTLNYSNEATVMPSTIVSSIEFDKDSEYFAIAGVTKRIKIFDYYACIRDAVVDIKHPINEMICTSKISCVAWNSYFKELLASSDYEGIVTVYDVETRVRKRVFQEHDKRCWSVDFNEIDTKLLASGSDDARVKLWSIDCENSVATLEVKTANVCCVKFNPASSCKS
jgi:E3 ubiquitin-protein ligase RFWD2